MKNTILVALFAGLALVHATALEPNIVYILCDDLGYGDVHCLGGERSKIPTPNMDAMAARGMIFTEAHSGSAVCTPTRYGILTGRYSWRTALQKSVFSGYSAPLIAPDRLTVPEFLRQHGYATACIGKWHLGMDLSAKNLESLITNGPTTRGFDYYFGISGSLDMPPFAFIENDHFVVTPSIKIDKKEFGREGPAAPGFQAVDVLPTLAHKAVDYIDEHAAATKQGKPFFIYLPLNSPHTPIAPSPEWLGKSSLGKYADFVMETDWAVGEVIAALEKNGIADKTLVILTSDNGCSPAAKPTQLEELGHFPSEWRRGYKADIWDGGHRIPFIAQWPEQIKPGSRSDQLICLNDLMATCANILSVKLPDNAGEDSVSILPAMLGKADKPLREGIVHHSINGYFAIRQGPWKLELCGTSGGWSDPRPDSPEVKQLPPVQLYDMTNDGGERTNEYNAHPEIVARLTALLEKYVADGRSTPGAPQKNDAAIDIWKINPAPAKSKKTNQQSPANAQ
jgi:arylsulfatase A-like enzyme